MLERIKTLENNVSVLAGLRDRFSVADIRGDKTYEWALRYGFLESIQIVIDISCHLVSTYNLGNPENYSECIELLKENGYLDKALAHKLTAMTGLRNLLVHEYVKVDPDKLFSLLENIGDFKEFVESIRGAL